MQDPRNVLDLSASRRPRLRTCLIGILVLALMPVLAVGVLGLLNTAKAYRASALDGLVEAARSISIAVESEIKTRAEILANYSDLSGYSAVSPEARDEDVNSPFSGRIIRRVVRPDVEGLNDGTSFDAAIARLMARAATSGRSEISDLLYPEGENGSPIIAMAVPAMVTQYGVPVSVLTMDPLRAVQTLTHGSTQQKHVLIAVTDGQGRIVSRSVDSEKFLGRPVPDWQELLNKKSDSGTFEAETIEGRRVVFAFSLIPDTAGWAVVLGEPLQAFEARWQTPLFRMIATSLVAVAIAIALGYGLTRLVLRPIDDLARHARQVAAGPNQADEIVVAPSLVREFDDLRVSLTGAENTLREQAAAERANALALARSERRYRALAEVGTLVFWRRAENGRFLALTGWKDLTGQPENEALSDGWMPYVHADDVGLVEAGWNEAFSGRALFDVEFRVAAAHGEWRWVRARGVQVLDDATGRIEWVGVMEDVDERRKAQASIAYIAHHDALTGLPNRLLFSERLQEALALAARGRSGAVIALDLDRFKEVNDTLGHPIGDLLLQSVTDRMKALVREQDTVARFGGDEFAIIQTDGNQPTAALALAERVIESLSEPYDLQGHHVVVGASAGVAVLTSEQTTAERVLKSADIALYRAKEEGRGCYRFFEPEMDARMQARRRMELDLRRALENGEFQVHYQPMINLREKRLVGFEALVRWEHPERGVLPPADFLPLAEDVGLIMPIGRWVLMRACADAAGWPGDLRVSVNLSPSQIASRSIVANVTDALSKSRLPPSRLEIEIRENALIDDHDHTTATLHSLKTLGVRVVMDNFGSGQSSIGCLRRFPFDKVKIDGTFIRSLDRGEGLAVVRAVTGLCGSLGITTTAEGIETEDQFDVLTAENCEEGQGFFFSQPCSHEEALQLCARFGLCAEEPERQRDRA